MHQLRCPTCGREFKSIHAYPRVLILRFERLPVPEAVDRHSAAAMEKRLVRKHRYDLSAEEVSINRTPEVAQVCANKEVEEFLAYLGGLVGQIVEPTKLKLPFKPSGIFKWAHPVPGTELFISLREEKPEDVQQGIADVEVYCDGPNLGSAGGPTLQPLGSIGRLGYQGLLL
jgi:hypothetical protein